MPVKEHLQLFARQLATWAEQIIENGRTPFRRVDLFHPLQTSAGLSHPPLIFWINRQSMIAGGVVFLPDAATDTRYQLEAATAAALGLRHFVTWESEQINIWEANTGANRLVTSLPLSDAGDLAVFHHRLFELIDQLKLLSITGRIDADVTPAYYLLNLLEECLALSYPALLDACRLQRSKTSSILTAEDEAEDWNRLTLLRLLCLLHWQLLPNNISGEEIPIVVSQMLPQLPTPLNDILQKLAPAAAAKLPPESAVAFHHLLLRLQQIGWQGREQRGEQALRLLLERWYGKAAESPAAPPNDRLLLHARDLAPSCHREVSHSGAQLAANTLWRTFEHRDHPTQLQGDAFRFDAPLPEPLLHANAGGDLCPDAQLRRELAGYLRTSWPNRHLTIPGHLPFWVPETAHLLGLCAPGSTIELHLPSNWLHLLAGTVFGELLFANFAMIRVDCRDDARHLLRLQRRQESVLTECLLPQGETRQLELGEDHKLAAGRLLYALELPAQTFELFAEQLLVPLTEGSEEAAHPQGLQLYVASGMGRQLWDLRCNASPPADKGSLLLTGSKNGWLVPEAGCLQEFENLLRSADSPDSDALLAQLLGIQAQEQLDIPTVQRQNAGTPQSFDRKLGEDLLRQLEIDGVPHFPQTYLYRLATGPLDNYRFVPPLRLCQEMLGQYDLEDATGQKLHIVGEETKDALLLASSLGLSGIEIPADRRQTAEMLDSYRSDLLALQDKISRLCHRHIEHPRGAQRLQKKLWQQLPLPPQKWLSG